MSVLAMTDKPQQKARILIIEDEAMIAFAIEQTLLADGFEIAGIAARLPAALTLIDGCAFDAAILDTNLAGVSAGPAAAALKSSGRPFIIASGYPPSQQPEVFRGAPCIQKPYPPKRLLELLREILPLARA
ncbi:MAG: response regulator [Hyphomonas sp.]|jgi:DNA-binding response OmpR family regulator|nr:response regulator [Hyphomonas sp.]